MKGKFLHDSIKSITLANNESSDKDLNVSKNQKSDYHTIVSTNPETTGATAVSDSRYRNKQRCLTLSSRGVSARHRHLLEDLRILIPHHKKESKLSLGKSISATKTGGMRNVIPEIAQLRSANTILFLEARKHTDAYLWIGRTLGPSIKFLLENIHTMNELRLTGNSLRGSRPFLVFDVNFRAKPHLMVVKCLLIDVFGTPRGHNRSKPFVDRVMSFFYVDGKIWVRNYQIMYKKPSDSREALRMKKNHGESVSTCLIEIGPRFVLNPIRIFRGSFGGQTIYQNDEYCSPNYIRSLDKKRKGNTYKDRKEAEKRRKEWKESIVVPNDTLSNVFKE